MVRRLGEVPYNVKLRKYQRQIMKSYKEGETINALTKKYNVKWLTMKRFVEVYSKMKKPKPLTEEPKKHGHPTYAEIEWFKKHKK